MLELAHKVKNHTISSDEIKTLVDFTISNGGIEYADKRMWEFHAKAEEFLNNDVSDEAIRKSLHAYLDFVIKRDK